MVGSSTSKRARQSIVRMAEEEDEEDVDYDNEEEIVPFKRHRLQHNAAEAQTTVPSPVSLSWPFCMFVLLVDYDDHSSQWCIVGHVWIFRMINMCQDVNVLANWEDEWNDVKNLFNYSGDQRDNILNISIHEDTPNNILQSDWIRKFAPRTEPCTIEDLPELKQVSNSIYYVLCELVI
jgi:hypothetical protein